MTPRSITATILIGLYVALGTAIGSTPKEIAQAALVEVRAQKVALAKAKASTTSALNKLESARSEIETLSASLEQARIESERLGLALTQRDAEIADLKHSVTVWQDKQKKALKEIWVYRSIVIGIVSIIGLFILLKLGILGAKIAS